MKLMAALLAGVIGLLASGTAAPEQPVPGSGRIEVSTLGPQVGGRVPDFSLRDQDGRARDLGSIVGRRGAMIVFVRSADW